MGNSLDDIFQDMRNDDSAWILIDKYAQYLAYEDDGNTYVDDRIIGSVSTQVSVQGESYSQYIPFIMNRFYDGIDISEKSIWIHYELTDKSGSESSPVNVFYNDDQIKFGWVIPIQATQQEGKITFSIWVNGTAPNEKEYLLKTLPKEYEIKKGHVPGSGINEPDDTWYMQFVKQMDTKVESAKQHSASALSSADAAGISEDNSAKSASDASQTLANATTVITQATTAAKADIANKATDTLATIPEDYAQIDGNVKTLKVHDVRYSARFSNALIGKASGTGMVGIADGAEAAIPDLEVFGKSGQVVTTGVQLLNDATNIQGQISGANGELIPSNAMVASDYIPVVGGTQYTLSSIDNNYYNIGICYDSDKTWFNQDIHFENVVNHQVTVTVPSNAKYIRIRFYSGSPSIALNPLQVSLKQFMFNMGVSPMPFESYTGAAPSPSPDYPQDIRSIGDSGNIDLSVVGANFANVEKAITGGKLPASMIPNGFVITPTSEGNRIITMPCKLKNGKQYYLNFDSKSTGTVEASASVYIKGDGMPEQYGVKGKFIPNADTSTLGIYVDSKYVGQDVRLDITNVQVNAGDTAMPCQPYKSQFITIPLTQPLRGIGDIRDRIMCRDGIWGVERLYKKVTFDGSADEAWKSYANWNNTAFAIVLPNGKKYGGYTTIADAFCDYLAVNTPSALTGNKGIGAFGIGLGFGGADLSDLYISLPGLVEKNNIASLRSYLSQKPLNLVHPVDTAIWEPFPADTQAALNSLTTYQGTTNIMVMGEDPDMSVEYVQDVNMVIAGLMSRIEALENA